MSVIYVFHAKFYEHGHSAHQATRSRIHDRYQNLWCYVFREKGPEDHIKDKFYDFKVGQVLKNLSKTQKKSFETAAIKAYERAGYLKEWLDLKNSPFRTFSCLSLQEEFVACFKKLEVEWRWPTVELVTLRRVRTVLNEAKNRSDLNLVNFFENCDSQQLLELVKYVFRIPISNAAPMPGPKICRNLRAWPKILKKN
jgi:hypothetical protein